MNPYRHISIFAIIASCVVVFTAEQSRESTFSESFGAIPSYVSSAIRAIAHGDVSFRAVRDLSRLVTALFLHGDVEHILYNMVFLWAFGYLVSDTLGQWWALAVFLVTGVCGNLVQVYLDGESMVQIIGASGAICGFQGVYFGLAIRWELPWPAVWPLAHPVPPIHLAVFAVLGFLFDIYFVANRGEGIAYGAHAGGFISGLAIAAIVTTIYPTYRKYELSVRTS